MRIAVSEMGNLRTLSQKIAAACISSGGKWLYIRENLDGVDKLANVGLLMLGMICSAVKMLSCLKPIRWTLGRHYFQIIKPNTHLTNHHKASATNPTKQK